MILLSLSEVYDPVLQVWELLCQKRTQWYHSILFREHQQL